MKKKSVSPVALLLGLVFAIMLLHSTAVAGDKVGIFEKILDASGTFDETVAAFEKGLGQSSLILHAKVDINSPDGMQKGRIYVMTSPTYMEAARDEPPNTISAQVLRAAVYEYGEGKRTFINMANPVAHAMVFYSTSDQYDGLLEAAAAAALEIREAAANVPGLSVSEQLEPTREEEAYRKFNGDGPAKMMTMFRNWEKSQSLILEAEAGDFSATVAKVENAIKASTDAGVDRSEGWRLLTQIPVRDDAVYFGITNLYTENSTVSINSDFRRRGKTDEAPYPGMDHIAAFPMEVIVYHDGDKVKAVHYGQMWRMQLYYWDSGYMAFAKYTLIPGRISRSIEETIRGKE